MEILELQTIFLSSIFLGTLFFSLIPLLCLRRASNVSLSARSARVLSYLNCVAAGVFIAMCFLGLLPLVQYQFTQILTELHVDTEFPVAECLVVLGFFFILIIEQLCTECYQRRNKRGGLSNADFELRSADGDSDSIRKLLDDDFEGGDQDVLYELNSQHRNPIGTSIKKSPLKNGTSTTSPKRGGGGGLQRRNFPESTTHSAHCRHLSTLTGQKLGLRFCVLVLALSIHAIFEGLALGLVKDKSKALRLFIAMLLHESICAFALGVNMAKRRLTGCACILYVLFFSLTVPTGIAIGLFLGQSEGIVSIAVAGVLQAFAAGIFIHVTFMEIIPAEFGDGRSGGLVKVLFLFIGFLTICAINVGQEVQQW